MARKRAELFFLILRDQDKKKFNIVGPMVDDSGYTRRTAELQEHSRDVRCQSIPVVAGVSEVAAKERTVTEYKKAFPDYVYDPALLW